MSKSLRVQIATRCVHFTGIQHDTCEAAVDYQSVRARDHKFPVNFPCFAEGPRTCDKARFPTEAEVDAEVAAKEAALDAFLGRAARGECAHCGVAVAKYVQSGSCAYAQPCGHRVGQAEANALNEALVQLRATP